MSSRFEPGFRTGPVGRIVRLAFVALLVLTLVSIVSSQGSARFRNPHILSEPSAWFLHAVMFLIFVLTVGVVASSLAGHRAARRAQVAAVVAAAAAVVLAGAVGLALRGSVWGFPLADLVWYFDVSMATIELLAFLLAIALGTPGCELGVWQELLARAGGRPFNRTDGLACIVGIHLIDRWEEHRRRVPA